MQAFAVVLALAGLAADDPVFSGPQPGEKLPGFKAVGVYGDDEGKERDFVKDAGDKPVLLIFVHEITRPTAALLRALSEYAATREKDGLQSCIVWLTADRTEATAFLKRAKDSLNLKVPVLISPDGIEGPGAYGLNRKVGLTILVAKGGKVTGNVALVQPALTDAVKVGEAICKAAGGTAPTAKDFEARAIGDRGDQMPTLLRAVIRKDASADEVKRAAEAVEKYV